MKNFSKFATKIMTLMVIALALFTGVSAAMPVDVIAASHVVDATGFILQQPELYFGMTMLVSLPKGTGAHRQGGPAGIKDIAYVIRKRDILTMPERDSNGVLIENDIIMNPGTFMGDLYGTRDKIEVKEMTEGDPDQEGSKPSIVLVHPGSYLEVQEWYKANMHEEFLVIIDRCNGEMELYGECCNGLRLKREKTMNGTTTTNQFTFEAPIPGDVAAIYRGAITKESFKATAAADATTIDVAAGAGRYRTGVNTEATALTDLLNPVHGKLYTLVGNTGSHPTSIAASSTFILKDGTAFSLTDGAQISLRAFKSGASSYVFVEQSRT